MEKEKVVFRKFEDGEVIALFPETRTSRWIGSYMHIGQHGDATPDLLTELEPATEEEYKSLADGLKSIGYNLEITENV
jgi:hypothetical protein